MEKPAGDAGRALCLFRPRGSMAVRRHLADWVWPELERAGIPVMMSPSGLLDKVDVIAARHSGLKIIIDHLALGQAQGRRMTRPSPILAIS